MELIFFRQNFSTWTLNIKLRVKCLYNFMKKLRAHVVWFFFYFYQVQVIHFDLREPFDLFNRSPRLCQRGTPPLKNRFVISFSVWFSMYVHFLLIFLSENIVQNEGSIRNPLSKKNFFFFSLFNIHSLKSLKRQI